MNILQRDITLHGQRIRIQEYVPSRLVRATPDEDVLVLVHGIAGSGRTWSAVLAELAKREFPHRVIVPDLLGHGASGTPRGDYSLGGFASGIRDVLLYLGHQHASIVGHSLGGGVAMQFAYQFPEMCGRLVLVDSGGLGTSVSAVLRATALPGTKLVLAATVNQCTARLGGWLAKRGPRTTAETKELLAHLGSLADPGRRNAFLHTARGVIDIRGQRISAVDRLYLGAAVPTLIIWGERDWIIPVAHGHRAAELIPGSRLEIFASAGHFPQAADPERFADVLREFISDSIAARLQPAQVRALLVPAQQD